MSQEPVERKTANLFVKVEPSLKERMQRAADARFGKNISLFVLTAGERLAAEVEAELAGTAPRPIVTDTDGRAA